MPNEHIPLVPPLYADPRSEEEKSRDFWKHNDPRFIRMGMFDRFEPFTNHYSEGEQFRLVSAATTTIPTAQYGMQPAAVLRIAQDDGSAKAFTIFGAALVAQINRMEDGDLPANVRIERGRSNAGHPMKLLVPEGMSVEDVNGAAATTVADAGDDDIPF